MADDVNMAGNRLQHLTARDFIFVCHTDTLHLSSKPYSISRPWCDRITTCSLFDTRLAMQYPLSYEALANITLGISTSDIKQLSIEFCSVGAFPKGLFDPLRDSSLSVLDFINGCDLNSLHPLVFFNLTKLKQFSFSYNTLPIDEIQPDFFEGMNALKVLIINNNQVSKINPHNQTWTVDLSEFRLIR